LCERINLTALLTINHRRRHLYKSGSNCGPNYSQGSNQ